MHCRAGVQPLRRRPGHAVGTHPHPLPRGPKNQPSLIAMCVSRLQRSAAPGPDGCQTPTASVESAYCVPATHGPMLASDQQPTTGAPPARPIPPQKDRREEPAPGLAVGSHESCLRAWMAGACGPTPPAVRCAPGPHEAAGSLTAGPLLLVLAWQAYKFDPICGDAKRAVCDPGTATLLTNSPDVRGCQKCPKGTFSPGGATLDPNATVMSCTPCASGYTTAGLGAGQAAGDCSEHSETFFWHSENIDALKLRAPGRCQEIDGGHRRSGV